jgi:HEAT repeat protein
MTPRLFLRVTLSMALSTACAAQAQAGIYRGPGTVVPPELAAGGVAAPAGFQADLTDWQFWWEFNKGRYLHEKRDGRPLAAIPAKDVSGKILPALVSVVEGTDPPSVRAASLLALAKIARKLERAKLRKMFLGALGDSQPVVRESATLALGIAGMSESIPHLEGLAHGADGNKQIGRTTVDDRIRAFACYSLGLIAQQSPDLYVKRRVFKQLHDLLARGKPPSPIDIQVAAILGISILNISADQRIVGNQELRRDVLEGLSKLQDGGTLNPAVRSHIPGAIARLIGRGTSEIHEKHKATFLTMLQDDATEAQVRRGAILALGQVTMATEVHGSDGVFSVALQRYARKGKEEQSRYFALVALGQIGGETNREFLMQVLTTGKKAIERPWAAMALGEMAFHRRSRDPKAKVDDAVGRLLLE